MIRKQFRHIRLNRLHNRSMWLFFGSLILLILVISISYIFATNRPALHTAQVWVAKNVTKNYVEPSPKPTTTTDPNPGYASAIFKLRIDKIDVKTPVIQGVDPSDTIKYEEWLTRGVALIPGMGTPGKGGNIFIYGHSSAEQASAYQKVFARLNELEKGDLISVWYNGKSYTYTVSEKKITSANDTSVLEPTTTETLNLMTCWPVGTNDQRLIITAPRSSGTPN